MEWTLTDHGDFLEKRYAQFIEERLPSYSLTWRSFIGNDGTAQMAKMCIKSIGGSTSMPKEAEFLRKQLSQHHYTILESLILLDHIIQKNFQVNGNFDDYLDLQNDFLAFHANSGRVRDNMNAILSLYCLDRDSKDKKVGDKKLNTSATKWIQGLEDYYQQRNTVLHGKKLPFGSLLGDFLIVEPQGDEANPSSWSSKYNWDDIDEAQLVDCKEYLTETFDGLIAKVNQLLFNVYDVLKETFEAGNYCLESPPADPEDSSSSGKGGFKF
jgi:hypothetical protein